MGAWLNGSATNARMSRESAIRGGYATGYYQPMILPMGSNAAKSLPSVQTAPMQEQGDDYGAAGALILRNMQYNQLKGHYMRILFVTGGLALSTIYLLFTRNRP